eukprot:gene23291-30527_t
MSYSSLKGSGLLLDDDDDGASVTHNVRSAFNSQTPPPASPGTPVVTVFFNSNPRQPKLSSESCSAVNEFLNNNDLVPSPAQFPGPPCTDPPHEDTVWGQEVSRMSTCVEVDAMKGAQWMDGVNIEFIYMPILASKVSQSGINVQVIVSVSEECSLNYEPIMYQIVV